MFASRKEAPRATRNIAEELPDDDGGPRTIGELVYGRQPYGRQPESQDEEEEEEDDGHVVATTTVEDLVLGDDKRSAAAGAKKAVMAAVDATEEAQAAGEASSRAKIVLSERAARRGTPLVSVSMLGILTDDERNEFGLLLEPVVVKLDETAPGDDAPPLIYEDEVKKKGTGRKATVTITPKRRPPSSAFDLDEDVDIAATTAKVARDLKESNVALEAVKNELREWERETIACDAGTVKVGQGVPGETELVPVVDKDLWRDTLDDAMRAALLRKGVVRLERAAGACDVLDVSAKGETKINNPLTASSKRKITATVVGTESKYVV